ncbi:uncharacterized protein LOC141655244 [Silene latifolia]|uniref:uncharacterized protein LOC141655244 n=1 Tax=Silene latifolia TaxID=37657 RepID=UPI003D776D14
MENILICQDIIRLYERKAVSPRCLFKLDLQKAYDTIEWDLLENLFKAMKFHVQFRGWIHQCVSTASYSLNMNGDSFGFFKDSIMILLRTFSTFFKSSGLKISKGKSNAYFNGIKDTLKKEILQLSGKKANYHLDI